MKLLPFAAVVITLVAIAVSRPAMAQGADIAFPLPEIRNAIGAGVGGVPDYMGSNDYMLGAAPTAFFRLGDTDRYVRVLAFDVNVNLIDSATWSFGPAINYRWGRSDVDDRQVDRMRDIDNTVELGIFGGWNWTGQDDPRHRFWVGAEFLQDVGGVHDGHLLSASVRYFKPVTRPLTLGAGVALTYGSKDYMNTYFGVSASDSMSSGLSTFSAGSGLRDVRIPLTAVFSFNPNWHLAGGIIYSRLLNDAADSPVTDDRGSANQFYFGAGIAYAW